jgi:hypothetical protein
LFDGEETTAIVILITDGHEVFAIPAIRTGDRTYEIKSANLYSKLELHKSVSHALSIPGAEV